MSDWISTDERKPNDEQKVLGWWPEAPHMSESVELLTFYASDSPVDGREVWRDWQGEDSDEPPYWTPWEAPK